MHLKITTDQVKMWNKVLVADKVVLTEIPTLVSWLNKYFSFPKNSLRVGVLFTSSLLLLFFFLKQKLIFAIANLLWSNFQMKCLTSFLVALLSADPS